MASGTYKGLAPLAAGAGIGWTSATQRVLLVSTGYAYVDGTRRWPDNASAVQIDIKTEGAQ